MGTIRNMTDEYPHKGIAFFHIPKTSGASTIHTLQHAVKHDRFIKGFDPCLFGPCKDYDSFSHDARASVYIVPHEFDASADLVCGHFAISTIQSIYPHHRIFTILRFPRTRLLSLWLYWRTIADEHLTPWGTWADYLKRARNPLADFLSDPAIACHTDNLFVRMLLWPDQRIPEAGFIDPSLDDALLTAARTTLAGLDFVGCVEEPNLDDRLGQWLGTRFARSVSNETTPIAPTLRPNLLRESTAAAFEALAMRTRLDDVLWREALERVIPAGSSAAVGDSSFLTSTFRYLRDSVATLDGGLPDQLARAQLELRNAQQDLRAASAALETMQSELDARTRELSAQSAELSAREAELAVCLHQRDRLKRKWQQSLSGRLRASMRSLRKSLSKQT